MGGRHEGWQVRMCESLEGEGLAQKSLITSLPPTPTTHITCALHSFFLNTGNTTSTCREDGDSSSQTESTGLSWYMFIQRTGALDQSSFSRSAPGTVWRPNSEILSPLFPLVGGKTGFLPSSDSPTSLHNLDRNNSTLQVKKKHWLARQAFITGLICPLQASQLL